MMRPRLISFVLGVLSTLVCVGALRIHATQDRSGKPPLAQGNLIGTWHGSESWGTKFTITRRADGTFSEERDFSRADVPGTPRIVQAKGRWSLHGNIYSIVYDEVSDKGAISQRPWSVAIEVKDPTNFRYFADEGNDVVEEKQ